MAKKPNDSVESLLERGLVALDAGDFEGALSQWNLVLEQDPGNSRSRRLVSDLEQLISDNRSGMMTSASGEFVVVVEDEPQVSAAPEGAAPNVISKAYLNRIKKVSDDTLADNEALTARMTHLQADLTEAKEAAATRETELSTARQGALELEQSKNALETETQDLTRFKRQHERQAAELDLRLAERKASERRLLADIEKLASERDGLKGGFDEAKSGLAKLESDLAEQTAANRKAEADQEKLREELEETRNALTSERASLEEARESLEAGTAQSVELENQLEAITAELEAGTLETTNLQADKEALEFTVGELTAAEEELEAQIADAESTAARNAEEITRLAAELAKVAIEAEERVNTATSALEESQAARSAMRTEMATIVQDLEKAKSRGADTAKELESAHSEISEKTGASAEALAAAEFKAIEASATTADLELNLNEANEALEGANFKLAELEVQLASEKKSLEHAAAAAAAQAAVEVSAAHKAVSDTQTASANAVTDADAKAASLAGEIDALKATAAVSTEEEAKLTKTNDALTEDLEALRSHTAALEAKQADVESSGELTQRLGDQEDAFTELQAQLMAKDVSIAELQSQLQLAARAHESPGLQAEVDRLKVALSAADGRARSATEEATELAEQVAALKASPIDMYVSGDHFNASERAPTPAENLSISGQFKAAEASANPPPLSAAAKPRPTGEDHGATPFDSSAVTRLKDEGLSPSDRLSWLIDEQPYVANTASVPDLSARAAFVLQNIDGSVSFADLIDIVGLPEVETYSILLDLWERGVITSPSLES